MPKSIVVCNAGPLISLASIARLNILRELFGKIYIPGAVYREVVIDAAGRPGGLEVSKSEWIERVQVNIEGVSKLMLERLDAGESESILLATNLNADFVVLDERLARRLAVRIGLSVVGTLGVLLMAKRAGSIPKVTPLLNDLENASFRMSWEVRSAIIEKAGE